MNIFRLNDLYRTILLFVKTIYLCQLCFCKIRNLYCTNDFFRIRNGWDGFICLLDFNPEIYI